MKLKTIIRKFSDRPSWQASTLKKMKQKRMPKIYKHSQDKCTAIHPYSKQEKSSKISLQNGKWENLELPKANGKDKKEERIYEYTNRVTYLTWSHYKISKQENVKSKRIICKIPKAGEIIELKLRIKMQ